MKTDFIIFIIVPTILMFIISVGMPFYCYSIMKKSGEKLMTLVRKKQIVSHIVAPVLSYLLVLLPYFIDMGKFGRIIPFCGVAGLFIVLKETNLSSKNGVYENLLINGSTVLHYSDIETLPEESAENSFVIVTKKHHTIQLVFDNANEAGEVLAKLKEILSKNQNQ